MHDVPDIHAIRVLHQRGLSKREIARTLGVSRKTVDKYTAPDYVVPARPAMRLGAPRPAPKMDRWKPVVEQWLEEDESAPRKQCVSSSKRGPVSGVIDMEKETTPSPGALTL